MASPSIIYDRSLSWCIFAPLLCYFLMDFYMTTHDPLSRTGKVVGGDLKNVKITWSNSRGNSSYSYSLQSKGEYTFQFHCREETVVKSRSFDDGDGVENDEDFLMLSKSRSSNDIVTIDDDSSSNSVPKKGISDSLWCKNCKLYKSKCLDGKLLLVVKEETCGMIIKACGSFWDKNMLGKNAKVVGGSGPSKVIIKWLHNDNDQTETHFLMTQSKYKFQFDCKFNNQQKNNENKQSQAGFEPRKLTSPSQTFDTLPTSHFALRLPFRKREDEILKHDLNGDKHHLLFCASENIQLKGRDDTRNLRD